MFHYEPLTTVVVQRPSQGLVSLEEAKSWLGLAGTIENDQSILDLVIEVSDYICGPNSQTGICFRQDWKLTDVWPNGFNFGDSIQLRYPVLLEIEEIVGIDSENNKIVIPPENYRSTKLQYTKSLLRFLKATNLCQTEITYTTGGVDIPRTVLLACKMALFTLFENRGTESEVTLKENPAFDRLLAPYVL